MTDWIRPCADASCIEYRVVDGGVEIGVTDLEAVLYATTEEWDALTAGFAKAALLGAADALARLIAGPSPASQWGEGYRSGVLASERTLRDRAERIGGGA
jgi:hypothetical protein